MTKKEIRQQVRTRKKTVTPAQVEAASARLAQQLYTLPEYRNAKSVYGYLSFNQEVRTLPILQQAMADGKRVAVPKVYGKTMRFLWLDDLTAVAPGCMGIPEPVADGPEADDAAALVLMPGVAFDEAGHRVGYGGGYYDRFLASQPDHPTVALCFDFQMFPELPTEDYDIPVGRVLWTGMED